MKWSVCFAASLVLLILTVPGAAAQPATTPADEEAAVRKILVEAYVEGIHVNRDIDAVRCGFHPDFVLTVHDDDQVIVVPLQMWIDRLQLDGVRTSHEIDYTFSSVDVAGDAATARMEIYEDGTHIYTDYFGLYKLPEGWKIVNKIFQDHD
jgi:hypothetical protein